MRDTLAKYKLIMTRSGRWSAIDLEQEVALHSLYDPVGEARGLAAKFIDPEVEHYLLIGDGIGYLADAMNDLAGSCNRVTVFEPEPELHSLKVSAHASSGVVHSRHVVVSTRAQALADLLIRTPSATRVVIAPYLRRLAQTRSDNLSSLINALAIEQAGNSIYNELIPQNISANSATFNELPSWREILLDRAKPTCIIGAGPSLDLCASALSSGGSQLNLIAVSGAIPSLRSLGIVPDCVIAMESLDACTHDLAELPGEVPIIVFPFTNPDVIASNRALFRGDFPLEQSLETRGGTSIIPALDLALQIFPEDIYLIGLDLGSGVQSYASNAKRAMHQSSLQRPAPKFGAMRFAIESLLLRKANQHRIYHVREGGSALTRTINMTPSQFSQREISYNSCELTNV